MKNLVLIEREDLEAAILLAAKAAAESVMQRMAQPQQNELWTAQQVAEYLGYSPRTVAEKSTSRRDFPQPINVGASNVKRTKRWRAEEVREWSASRAAA